MKVTVLKNYEELSMETAEQIVRFIKNKPNALLCFAAGSTPIRTFEILVDYAEKEEVDFSGCKFVGLDEWVGMDKSDIGSCQETLYSTLFEPLHIKDENICFFHAKSEELQQECKRIDQFILDNGKIDLMLLGIGVNGHLGFNEPDVSFSHLSHVVNLDEKTKEVGQKYFENRKELSKGITLGPKHILDSAAVILTANGSYKAAAVHKMLTGNVTAKLPASILQTHQECFVLLDEKAAHLLG
jgi:glucosamine-6-phosphate deaminase